MINGRVGSLLSLFSFFPEFEIKIFAWKWASRKTLLGSAYRRSVSCGSLITKRTNDSKPFIYLALLRNRKSAFQDSKLETNLNLIVREELRRSALAATELQLLEPARSEQAEIALCDLKPHTISLVQSKFIYFEFLSFSILKFPSNCRS